jgi:hypothetical protein
MYVHDVQKGKVYRNFDVNYEDKFFNIDESFSNFNLSREDNKQRISRLLQEKSIKFNDNELEGILVRKDKFKKRWIPQNQVKNKFKFSLSLPRILKWENDNIQYCTICRVELDNLKEKVAIISGYNSVVHEIYINRFRYNKMCSICNDHFFQYKWIKHNTEKDTHLFDSKTF